LWLTTCCHGVQSHPIHIMQFRFTCFVPYFALSTLRFLNIFINFLPFLRVKLLVFCTLIPYSYLVIFKHKFNCSLLCFQSSQQQMCKVAITWTHLIAFLSVLLTHETSFHNQATPCLYSLAPLSPRVSFPGNTFKRF